MHDNQAAIGQLKWNIEHGKSLQRTHRHHPFPELFRVPD
jgi:hypothetical protein